MANPGVGFAILFARVLRRIFIGMMMPAHLDLPYQCRKGPKENNHNHKGAE